MLLIVILLCSYYSNWFRIYVNCVDRLDIFAEGANL